MTAKDILEPQTLAIVRDAIRAANVAVEAYLAERSFGDSDVIHFSDFEQLSDFASNADFLADRIGDRLSITQIEATK